ncbi:apolipoprotein B-100-like [Lampris incognitus]|uniref:apolipoprotein B-100-like n=1 Tax=Lampris incognitus TaxID=2546036 RepID=UPI0024B54499|nr:apolipoprotein B-100-like [Lampris incognitus]
MGESKLGLLLLLTTFALASAQDEDHPTCLLAKRYKTLHKYEYLYEAESMNAINGASQLKNGPRASCKVEIEVPQTCSFIVRTTGCTLSEVADMDAEGSPVYRPAAGSDAFEAEMERYPLKVVVDGVYDVQLYPEEGETTTILNIKRGIISALAVPLLEEQKNKNMPTIHGMCKTHYSVNARQDIATDISLTRDLSRCDKFIPMRDHTSPLALISGMHYPLSQLVRSSQTCNYKFDNENKHMTSGACMEKHILVPFSHKGEYGVTNVGKQALTLMEVSAYNDRVFDYNEANVRGLHMEAPEDKNVIQDKDAGLALLGELANLPETEGERRAHLFHKLVSMLRGMKAETLRSAIPKALEVSRALTFQVLAQCGTPECSSAIMQILRTYDSSSLEVDATIFALGLVSNPSPLLINDMLEMAQYKSSKPIMYALSNVVKRFYKAEGKLIPEIHSVAEFMAAQLGDCSGDKDHTFMTLRVIGNMAAAMGGASPALRIAVMKCVNQPAASPTVQQAAIQAFRLTPVPEEGREVLMQVLLDSANPLQKRVAAYLILMKDPHASELAQLVAALPTEQDQQAKSFVISHITNILSSTEPETQELRQKILAALQDNEIGPVMDPTKFSRNYKIGSVEGNMIFEGTNFLPKEVMLEMTLKAFGYDIDMMEIGMEGKGFEPTVEALFGENGFFPDTTLKTMYFISDNMPLGFSEVLKNMLPTLKNDRQKRQASQSLMREIGRNINKLVRELKSQESPEAMVYLRLLGNELGYLRTNDMEEMAYSAAMMIDSMLKMFPTDLMKGLMTKTDNKIFAHYIFMDNEFFLPTATGIPLRIALSGTFTPGIKGGLNFARDMNEVTFMPSAGIEFVTRVGSHIPEYVNSGLEMHTNLFHESGLTAKLSIGSNHVKLTIPPPRNPTKLLSITNNLVAVTGAEVKTIPPVVKDNVDVKACSPFFAGMKYCTVMQYTDAFSHETAPYFPFTGDSKMAVELHPTGDVTDYTATIAYELLKEGEEGRQKVDTVKMILRAEGAEPTEATATVKYNRRKHVLTTDIQIPDYDVEAGLRLGVLTSNTKGKATHSISLDLINKNIPQLSLVGRANLKAMKQAMLEVQLLIPSIKADATGTANLKLGEKKELELKSDIKFLETTSEQKITVKYDYKKIEAEIESDVDSQILDILPHRDMIGKYVNQLLDMQVGDTDIKVRHILTKSVEETNNYMEKYASDIPYIQNFRVPDLPEISLPEKLFMKVESKAVYYFNNEHFTIAIPVPLGGKSTEDLNFPPALSTPHLSLPQFGLEIVSMKIPIPELFVPESLTVSVPLFGKAEVSAAIKSNLYDLEVSMAAGKDVVETPSYSATFDVKGTSPLDIFSFEFDGSGMLSNSESIKAQLKSSLAHKFLEASITVVEDGTITDKISVKSSSKMEAKSPFGLNVAFEHTGMVDLNTEQISADSNLEGRVKAGPIYGNTISTQSFTIFPFKPEAKIESSLKIDSTIVQVQNTIVANFFNGELSVVSNTNAFEDVLTHIAELSFREQKLSMKSDTNTFAIGMKIRHQAEATAGQGAVLVKVETNADHSENRIYSLLTASLDVNGLAVNSDAAMKLLQNEATHKATLTMNKDGLATSGKNTLKSPLTLENTFSAGLDASKATLSINNNAALLDIKVDNANTMTITPSNFDFRSKAESTFTEHASYTHDIAIHLKPYTASANVNNNLKLLSASFVNEAQLMAEPYRMDLIGSMKSIYGEEEVKHTYQINYADLTASAKCSTTGKLFGTHMSHNTGLEIVGLAVSITNDARFNSQPMRFDHTIRASIVPFDFNFDAIFNADGDLTLYGKHSGQLYGKFLLKAQPLAFATSHEYRGSVTQQLNNGFSLETTMDNKMDTLLTPQEQKTNFRMKYKMNNHAFNQDISVYNTAKITGMEVSGTVLTNIINTASSENQEFTISGFLKYDKNTNNHILQIPLIGHFPAFLESIKITVVSMAEALHSYINDEEVKAKLEALPQHVSEFVTQLNIKGKVATISETVTEKFSQGMSAINEKIYIKRLMVIMIDAINGLIEQIDLEKVKGSSFAFLYEIDTMFNIKSEIQKFMWNLKQFIQNFEISQFIAEVKSLISSINLEGYIEDLMVLNREFVDDTISIFMEMNEYFGIPDKYNTFYSEVWGLIVKFEVDKKVEAILEKALMLIKQFKIEETIKAMANSFKALDIPSKFMQAMEDTIHYLKATEFKLVIEQLNVYLDTVVQELKTFDYNTFVRQTNQMIAKYTTNINELIIALEVPQKIEATRDFINLVLSSFRDFMEQLREIRIAEIIKTMKEIFDSVLLNDLKKFTETMKKDLQPDITFYLKQLSTCYTKAMNTIDNIVTITFEVIQRVTAEQKIIGEVKQIIEGLITALKSAELDIPSFTFPFTDLVVRPMKLRMDQLQKMEIPTQLDIPEFTILGFHTVTATTISTDDIKQRITELIDFIVNFEIKMLDIDAFFGDLNLNYLPVMPEITIPEINFSEFSFPTIPQVPVENLFKTLQIPEIKLPTIQSEIMVPCFGKLYGGMRFFTPIYTFKVSGEFKNSTANEMNPQFNGLLTFEGTSPMSAMLDYNLDSTIQIAVPKNRRIVFTETLKLNHQILGIDHSASSSLYGRSAQAQSLTTMKVTTEAYTANIVNKAFIAMEGGVSASLETTYNHNVNLPIIDFSSVADLKQAAILRQEGTNIHITVENVGTANFNAEVGSYKSNLLLNIDPNLVKLTFSADTDSTVIKMKQQMSAESAFLGSFKFDARIEADGPAIKDSLIVASGYASLYDLKIEIRADHYTELYGPVSGVLSNTINTVVRPTEFVLDFQNKGSTKVKLLDVFIAKIDLQNDYSVILKPQTQQINTVALARLNQYKVFYNVTVDNNEKEAGIFVQVDGEANLDFLDNPISIPEIDLSFISWSTPAINDLNLYEDTGLKHILTTTEQTVNADAKIVYQKSKNSPLVDVMNLIQIPSLGNLITELSFKSAIINVNVNAGLYAEDDLVFRLGANTASVFEALKVKLDGTTSLTTKRGIKLANSLSLENRHIEGTHDSTVSVSTETFETAVSVATAAKITLPILNMEVNQNLAADTKSKANTVSTFKLKGNFNVPMIKAVGKVETDHSLKLEGTLEYVTMESTTKANTDGRVLENYLILGVLDNEVNLYLNNDGLRSTSKVISDVKLHHGSSKVLSMDMNENLALEASMSRVYGLLKFTGNNEANIFNFNTKGKHVAQATVDIAPTLLTADVQIDMSQPSDLGDLIVFEKAIVELTLPKQKISFDGKIVTAVYATNLKAEVQGDSFVLKAALKSSATSPIVFLEYDMDASTTANFENEALNMISKVVLTHTDLTMDVHHVITQALGTFRHTLNVDITSPTFTDVNFRYAARGDGISASVSIPSSGFLGLQFRGRVPSQMSARIYSRYVSAPEEDVDVLVIRASPKDADKVNLRIAYNMEAPKDLLFGLKERLPSIMSTFANFADKYKVTRQVEELRNTVVNLVREAYTNAINYDIQMSQLSIFFRNFIIQYQKTVQVFLDAVVKVLRDTKFMLPGSQEMTTLPEVLKKLTSSIVAMFEKAFQIVCDNTEVYFNYFTEMISNIKIQMPGYDMVTAGQVLDQMKTSSKNILNTVVDLVKKMESLDMMLVKLGETLKDMVEISQDFVDSIKSDYLDAVFININVLHRNLLTILNNIFDQMSALNMEQLYNTIEYITDMLISVVSQFNNTISGFLHQASEDVQPYMKMIDGRLEFDLPFAFQQ